MTGPGFSIGVGLAVFALLQFVFHAPFGLTLGVGVLLAAFLGWRDRKRHENRDDA